jgi:hypothetical protein
VAARVEAGAPQSVIVGQLDTGAKTSCHFILIPGYFRNWYKLVKSIENSLFIRKRCIIYQNV